MNVTMSYQAKYAIKKKNNKQQQAGANWKSIDLLFSMNGIQRLKAFFDFEHFSIRRKFIKFESEWSFPYQFGILYR